MTGIKALAASLAGVALLLSGCSGGGSGEELVAEVQAAFADSYGSTSDHQIERFTTDNGSKTVTVVSSLADKPENAELARGVCMTVASVAGDRITQEWDRVIVTAGDRGAFIAECKPVG